VHDDAGRLAGALRSVPQGVATVVVDDGSSDGGGALAARLGATVVRHDTARGPAAARNAGLAAVHTPFVAFLDADVLAEPGWLTTLLPHLGRDDVALVGPRITALHPDDPQLLARYEAATSPLDRGAAPAVVEPRGAVDYLPSAALVGRAAALRAVGGFDESLHFSEDVDLCHRLNAAGWQVRYDPAAQVMHDHRTRWRSWLRRRVAYGSGAPDVTDRHGSPHPPVPLAGAVAALWVLAGRGPLHRRVLTASAVAAAGAARTAAVAVQAGVPPREALEGGLRREVAAARRVVGLLPRQSGLPLTTAWSLTTARGRRLGPLAVVLQHLRQWRDLEPSLSPYAFVGLRVCDEGALAVGLWRACWHARTLRPLFPRLWGPPAVRRVR
jgi:mycofactocin system glycosyltransferase